MIETNYFKVDVQYLQKSQLLVAAKTSDEAVEMVKSNVTEGTENFAVTGVAELTDEEKKWVLQNMQGIADENEEPSGEVQDTRTLN